jgi:fucose 4-O-acetylase-like acetyltransferase
VGVEAADNMSRKRLLYIDNLRILLTILVIVFHLAITYGSPVGDWQYKEGQPGAIEGIFYTTFVAVVQAFSMGFFFLISGYFTPGSFDRKGAGAFLRDRVLRLGVPLLVYLVFIDPVIAFVLALSGGFNGSFLDFLKVYIGDYRGLGSGPLWFLEALLIFSFGYALIRRLWRGSDIEIKVPGNRAIAFFGLTLGIVTFFLRIWLPLGYNFALLNLQIPFFPQYIALFAIGVLAYRGNWLKQLSREAGGLWSKVSIGLIMLFLVLLALGASDGDPTRFAGGFHWQAFTLAIWEQFTCIAIVFALTVLFRVRYNSQGSLAKAMSESAYTAYIIHAPVIILLALGLRGVQLPLPLKWVSVSGLAVPVCFTFSYFIRRLPIAQRIL